MDHPSFSARIASCVLWNIFFSLEFWNWFTKIMPRKAMKVIVELDIHTVRLHDDVWSNFKISPRSQVVANDATQTRALELCWWLTWWSYLSAFVHLLGNMPWNVSSRLWLCLSESELHGFRSKHEVCSSNISIVLPRTLALRKGKTRPSCGSAESSWIPFSSRFLCVCC